MTAKPRVSLRRRYYDTFDWRLYRNGYVFETDDLEPPTGRIRSLGRRGDQITTVLGREPDFAWNFEQSELRESLKQFLAVRRLLCQAETRVSIEPFEVMDSGGKVLLRLELEKYQRREQTGRYRSFLVNCRFSPLKGYHNVCNSMLDLIDADAGKPVITRDPLLVILSMDNKLPGGYSSKFNLTFNQEMSIGQVLAQTLLFHLDIIVKNLPGLRQDLDTEFLHDLRIANRRSRTLVTQIKQVLPPVKEKHYREIFSWLSKETSEHRDLDVFLQDIPRHLSVLPDKMRNDLEPLRAALSERWNKTHQRLLQVLDSEKFNSFVSDYRACLTAGLRDHFQTVAGSRTALVIANRVIWQAYQKMLKQGSMVSQSGDREVLHELRKTAKKLRYLLETFRSLYPWQDMENVIMQCRKMQNILGQIVDFRVQQNYLMGLVDGAGRASVFPDTTVACIRYLIDAYNKLEVTAYAKFAGRFRRFSEPGVSEQFEKLFKVTG